MKTTSQISELFSKVSETFSITTCHNGFMLDVSGEDKNGDWCSFKLLFPSNEELAAKIKQLSAMPRS